MSWKNPPLTAYHGTDSVALKNYKIVANRKVAGFKVDLSKCRQRTDFGRGFYLTTSEIQARNWANTKVRKRVNNSSAKAVLLSFKLDRDWLIQLESLSFILPDSPYWDLVEFCRAGKKPHLRKSGKSQYEMVMGPVSLWEQYLTVQSADQVSFHCQNVCNNLPTPKVEDIASYKKKRFEVRTV